MPAARPSGKPYDATTKFLVDTSPIDWLQFFGLPGTGAEVIDADLSTITTDADRVIRFYAPDGILHIEFESGHSAYLAPERLLRYSVLLSYAYGVPVTSALILLRKEADSPRLSRTFVGRRPDGTRPYLTFRYTILRIWEHTVEEFLAGGLSLLPLAPLANISESDLPEVAGRMSERFHAESGSSERERELWTATYVLMGLKYAPEITNAVLKGVRQMKESSTYQFILSEGRVEGRVEGRAEGRADEARSLILRLGSKRFGALSSERAERLAAVTDPDRLDRMAAQLLDVETWDELLQD